MKQREFKYLMGKISFQNTKQLGPELIDNLLPEERHSLVVHLVTNRFPVPCFIILDEDQQWLASCGYGYEKINKGGIKYSCTVENMSRIVSAEDEHQQIISYAINNYGFLLWRQKQFTSDQLAASIKEHYEINPSRSCVLNHLHSAQGKVFTNPQYFLEK